MNSIIQTQIGIDDILKKMSIIRRKGRVTYTNYYNQCNSFNNKFKVFTSNLSIAFEWVDLGIKRIYFYSSDMNDLSNVLSLFDSGSVIDYITKDKEVMSKCINDAGYKIHLEYGRFFVKPRTGEEEKKMLALREALNNAYLNEKNVNGNNENPNNECFVSYYVGKADVSDAEIIDRQLREEFDVYEAHFYSIEKLKDLISKGWVWVVKINNDIIAANIFEIQGIKTYGAYLYNRGDLDVLSSLLSSVEQYISRLGVKYYYCWMRLSNKKAIRYNMKVNGYAPDGVFDMIYVKG